MSTCTAIATVLARNVQPTHKRHDCSCCIFLGTVVREAAYGVSPKPAPADLYFCPNGGELIRRFGPQGAAYGAIGVVEAEMMPGSDYALALKLAAKYHAGLIERPFVRNSYRVASQPAQR